MEEEEDFKDLVATPQSWYYTLCMVLMDVYSIYSFIKRKSYLRGFFAGAFVSLFVIFWHTLPVVNNRITELQDPRAAGRGKGCCAVQWGIVASLREGQREGGGSSNGNAADGYTFVCA